MKRLLAVLIAAVIMLSLTSCGIDTDDLAGLESLLGEISKQIGDASLPSESDWNAIESAMLNEKCPLSA